MYLVYIDESGDTGLLQDGSPTNAFVLSALVLQESEWLNTLDALKNYRKWVRVNFKLRERDELRSSYLIHGTGPFTELKTSDSARMRLFKQSLRMQQKIGTLHTWAVLIDKTKWDPNVASHSIREIAWRYMIQRIERFTNYGQENCIIFPDEGQDKYITSTFRRMRRFNIVPSAYVSQSSLSRPATFIVEDPNFRVSGQSYFVQLADLNAYAAHRKYFPESYFGEGYWDALGDSRVQEVNRIRGGPRGIVVWP